MAVTLKDIAKMTGVSRPAISMLLNDPATRHVTEEKKQLVFRAMEESGYHPNYAARQLKGISGRLIGIIGALFTVPVHSALIHAVTIAFQRRGYQVLLGDHDDDDALERELVRDFETRGVDAFLFLCSSSNSQLASKRPNLLITNNHAESDISTDIELGGFLAGRHLLEHGHRKIGYLERRWNTTTQRFSGLRHALNESGYDVDKHHHLAFEDPRFQERLHQSIRNGVTGFFCSNDQVATCLYGQLHKLGVCVGKDVAVIGFDGLTFGRLLTPSLTTIAQPIDALAEKTVERMLRKLSGKNEKEAPELLPPQLIPGESCGCKAPPFELSGLLNNRLTIL